MERPFPVLGVIRTMALRVSKIIRTVIRTEVGSGSMARPVFTLNRYRRRSVYKIYRCVALTGKYGHISVGYDST